MTEKSGQVSVAVEMRGENIRRWGLEETGGNSALSCGLERREVGKMMRIRDIVLVGVNGPVWDQVLHGSCPAG